jgi:hypothetical protein
MPDAPDGLSPEVVERAAEREAEIEARLAAATKGPWDWQAGLMAEGSERTYAGYPQRIVAQDDGLVLIAETFDGHEDEAPPHAVLIANAPSDLRYLLDRCAALTAAGLPDLLRDNERLRVVADAAWAMLTSMASSREWNRAEGRLRSALAALTPKEDAE